MNRKGKIVALATVGVGVVVLAVAVTMKDRIVEEYYIQCLRSSDEATRQGAVEVLAGAQSVRSVSYLIALLKRERREKCCHYSLGTADHLVEEKVIMTPLAFALYRIGRGALPSLEQAKRIEEQLLLEENGSLDHASDDPIATLKAIRRCIESPDQIVRTEPYDSPTWKRPIWKRLDK